VLYCTKWCSNLCVACLGARAGTAGQRWDRSHLLENLSGYETSCDMIDSDDWEFTKARTIAANYGLRITAVYGSAPNHGDTDLALDRILENFKQVSSNARTSLFQTTLAVK